MILTSKRWLLLGKPAGGESPWESNVRVEKVAAGTCVTITEKGISSPHVGLPDMSARFELRKRASKNRLPSPACPAGSQVSFSAAQRPNDFERGGQLKVRNLGAQPIFCGKSGIAES
jgi:hypothetical protein